MLLRNKNILCIGGFDPSGAAGVLADVRMASSWGAHASAIVSVQTCQSRSGLRQAITAPIAELQAQFETLLADTPVHAVKLGAIGNIEQAHWLLSVLPSLHCPIVLDPVLISSNGVALSSLTTEQGLTALRALADIASIITPNRREAGLLFGMDEQQPAWTTSCTSPLLVTGSDYAQDHAKAQLSHSLLYQSFRHDFQVEVRHGRYRGSGCLLATALSCALLVEDVQDTTVDSTINLPGLQHASALALARVDQWLAEAWTFPDGIHLPQQPS